MTRQTLGATRGDTSKFTISTWVYIPKTAIDAQNKVAPTLDDHVAPVSVRKRIPIWQFGTSVEPLVGIHIGISMSWEGYLGWFWWGGLVTPPSFPDYLCGYWIGGEGMGRKGWYPFGGGRAYPSNDYNKMWENARFVFFGTSAAGAGTAFYYMPPGRNIFPITPVPQYDGFDDTGMLPYYVRNDGLLGPNFASYAGGDYFGDYALPMSWSFTGVLKATDNFNPGRVSVKPGDIADKCILVESEIYFTSFWSDPKNGTMQPTPTHGPDAYNLLRVTSGPGVGTYYAYGDLVVVFPKLPNITYGEPSIPSTLYYDGNIRFLLTGKWPKETTGADQEIVPTLLFSAGGFVVESWNHIFLTVDMTEMVVTGGQDDKEKTVWIDTLDGLKLVHDGLRPPNMEVPPKFAMWVNGKPYYNVEAKLTVYPTKGGHWKTEKTFKMAGGQIGFPNITQEKGRYKVTGPNQEIEYAYTHVYLNQYIEPTTKNLSKFFWKSKNKQYNNVIPPPDKKAAVKAFGKPDIWLYRDKMGDVEWKNLGTAGGFQNVGTKPEDFRPGPGQPVRK